MREFINIKHFFLLIKLIYSTLFIPCQAMLRLGESKSLVELTKMVPGNALEGDWRPLQLCILGTILCKKRKKLKEIFFLVCLLVSFFWEANYGRLCKVTQSEGRVRMTASTKNAPWWLWRGSCQHSASRRAQVKEKKKEKKLKPSRKSWWFSLEHCRLMNNSPKKS